jgi:hypothetical protein
MVQDLFVNNTWKQIGLAIPDTSARLFFEVNLLLMLESTVNAGG